MRKETHYMFNLTQDQLTSINLNATNVKITDEMVEKLKYELFMHGTDAIDDFLGFECDDKDVADSAIDNIVALKPPVEFMGFYCKFIMAENTYPYIYQTQKFYFTFGDSPNFPYKDGWIVIEAPNEHIARKIFALLYPNTTDDILRCSFVYDETSWKNTTMYKNNTNFGKSCHASFGLFNKTNL